VGRLQRRLGRLEGVARAVVDRRSDRDLSIFDDDEIEALAAFAAKVEACPDGRERRHVFTAEECRVLERLQVKHARLAQGPATSH
jgi:hypothetical protein